jgi:formylglycine-generating enzyme required for sulfatase activity
VTNAQYGSFGAFRGQNRPRESVSWFEAAAFCASRGGRLPSEAEWEYAAKGPDDLPFPWGSTFDSLLVIDGQDPEGSTADVGTRPDGGSWVGALDMSGNVWEWTGSIYHSYPYDPNDGREDTEPSNQDRPVVRGGSWISAQEKLTTTYRERSLPTYRDNLIGFRCVLDLLP